MGIDIICFHFHTLDMSQFSSYSKVISNIFLFFYFDILEKYVILYMINVSFIGYLVSVPLIPFV